MLFFDIHRRTKVLHFRPIWVLFYTMIFHFVPGERQVVLLGIKLAYAPREAIEVAHLVGVGAVALEIHAHGFERIGFAVEFFFGDAPAEEIPVGGLLESHLYATLIDQLFPRETSQLVHVYTAAYFVHLAQRSCGVVLRTTLLA